MPCWRRQSGLSSYRRRLRSGGKRLVQSEGSAILEFAIAVPLLVVFVVGIYDFSGAFNQKQKIEQAAQEGAIIAATQPMTDIVPGSTTTPEAGPASLQPAVVAVFNSLAASGVLPNANQTGGTCAASPLSETQAVLTYTYKFTGCSGNAAGTSPGCLGDTSDTLYVVINRGWVTGTSPTVVGTTVTVSYDYDWRFNSVIQLLIPGAGYAARTCITESASVHNQM
ncbi:MAG TPA: TadE family protein [Terriglobales bacterium]|nr:TadE family protein [Terriglobales bacterium]